MSISAYIAGAAFAGVSAVAIRYRPIPDFGHLEPKKSAAVTRYRSMDLGKEPGVLLFCRGLTMTTGALGSKFLMHVLNTLEIVENEHYHNWLKNIRGRPKGTPLITVANHGIPRPPTRARTRPERRRRPPQRPASTTRASWAASSPTTSSPTPGGCAGASASRASASAAAPCGRASPAWGRSAPPQRAAAALTRGRARRTHRHGRSLPPPTPCLSSHCPS